MLAATIDALTLDEHRVLIKAFSNYFQLINIAEDQQRVRVLRQREATGVLGESLDAAMRSLMRRGRDCGHHARSSLRGCRSGLC